MSPPWPLIYAIEGAERARRRRMTNHATTPPIKAAPMMPPTTPPAIAPAFELLLCAVEVEAADVPDADELGVRVDWETLTVDVGTIEAVPVTSGESGRQEKMNTCVVYRAQGSRTSCGLRRRDIPIVPDL
jgi:hypothetical protein